MKRIKQIIEALKVLSHTPSKVIKQAIVNVLLDAESNTGTAYKATEQERTLVSNLLTAVLHIAEEIEAKADGEVKA